MNNPNQFHIQFKTAAQAYHVLQLEGVEKLSMPFSFTVQFIVPGELMLTVLNSAQLRLSPTRTVSGVIKSIAASLLTEQPLQQLVTVEFTPLLATLENYSAVRVILDQSPVAIVKQTLLANGYTEPQLKFTLTEKYENKPYVLQAQGETHLAFIQRLLAKAGIFYWSETDSVSGQEILHFADNPVYCSYLDDTVNYIAPSGLFPHTDNSAITPRGFSQLSLKHKAIAPLQQIIDHNEMRPQHKIDVQHGNVNNNLPSQYTYYGEGALDQTEAKRLAELYHQVEKVKEFQLTGTGNLPELAVGSSIKLAADGFSKLATGDYLVIAVAHFAAQTVAQFGEENPYQNKATMVARTVNYKADIPPHPPMPSLFHACIESNQGNALLDEQGRYRLRHFLDRSAQPVAKATPPLPRLQAYGGNPQDNSVGIHAPLLNGAEVLMGCIHGDPDRPVIYGTVPNPEQQSPVTSQNRSQYRFVSRLGHELLMDDKIDQEQIRLSNPNLVNHLTMDATKDNHVLTLASQQGEMLWQAKQQMQLKSDDSTLEIINNNKEQTAGQNFQTETKTGDIHQQAATDHNFTAENNLQKLAAQNIEIATGGDLNWQSQQHLQLTGLGQGAQIHVKQGNTIIQSAQHINVFGDGQGMLEFLQARSGFQITPDGTINLFGNNITVMSPNPVNFKGKVNHLDSGAPTIAPATAPDPLTGQPIGVLQPQEGNLKTIQDILNVNLHFDVEKQEAANNHFLEDFIYNIVCYDLVEGADNNIEKQNLRSFQGVIRNAKLHVDGIDLKQTIEISLQDPKTQQAIYFIAQDKQPCVPQTTLLIKSDGNVKEQKLKGDQNDPNEETNIFYTRLLNLTILHPVIIFNFRSDDLEIFTYLREECGAPMTAKQIEHMLRYQPYCLAVNEEGSEVAEDEDYKAVLKDDYYRRTKFTNEEIKFFKESGNNATLFIHGYNVDYGQFNKCFITENVQIPATGETIIGFSSQDSTLFRDPAKSIPQFYENGWEYDEATINGKGAHEWYVCMPYNLNKATGQFDGKDYTKYTNTVNIAWQGDVNVPSDYTAAVALAKYPGSLVANLIQQLRLEKIEVNVIAHSCGNLVLMNALEELSHMKQQVQHAFMWEAAIPDNIFTTAQPADEFSQKHYYFPHAAQAVEKITVLYSQHDNILGPMPPDIKGFIKVAEELRQKYDDPGSGIALAGLAFACHIVDSPRLPNHLRSAYNVTNILAMPIGWFLPDNPIENYNVENYYDGFLSENTFDYYGFPLEDTLGKQFHIRIKNSSSLALAWSWIVYVLLIEYGQLTSKGEGGLEALFTLTSDMETAAQESVCKFIPLGEWIAEIRDQGQDVTQKMIAEFLHSNYPGYGQVATLFLTVFICKDIKARPALGYSGPDLADNNTSNLIKNGKLFPADQRDWLIEHSAMKYPTDDLMTNVYQQYVIGNQGLKKFGKYHLK